MINEKEQILELFDLAIAQLVSGEKSNLLEFNLNHFPKNELEKSLALFDRLIHKPDSDTLLNKTFSNKADKIESKELANALERFHTSDKKDTIRRLIVEEKHEIQKISCFLILLNKSLNFFLYFLISFIVTYIINLGDGIVEATKNTASMEYIIFIPQFLLIFYSISIFLNSLTIYLWNKTLSSQFTRFYIVSSSKNKFKLTAKQCIVKSLGSVTSCLFLGLVDTIYIFGNDKKLFSDYLANTETIIL